MVILVLIFWGLSTGAAPVYIPTNTAQGFLYLHVLSNTWYLLGLVWGIFLLVFFSDDRIPAGVGWRLTVVLTRVSLMISDVAHLFICLLAICPLCKNVYSDLLPFLNLIVWIFMLSSWMSSLYVLDINRLSDTRFENIFRHWVGCLHFQYFAWNLSIGEVVL